MAQLSEQERSAAVARVLWIVLVLNLLVAGTKLTVAVLTGALSLMADGLHSVLDASSNVVGLVGIRFAARPPDRGHPYGHKRFETIAALVIGLLIGAGALELVHQVVAGVLGDRPAPTVSWLAAGVVLGTVVINLFISSYESRRGSQLRSAILSADSKHTLSDAAAAFVVLAGFGAIALGWRSADLLAAAAVSLFVGRTAWQVLKDNFGVLADESRLDPDEVRQVAMSVDGVLGAHRIRSRGGMDAVQVDLHIQLPATLNVTEAHSKTHEVIRALRVSFPAVVDVVIHTEPADGRELDRSRVAPDP